MGFRVSQKTLERLDWRQVLERLAKHAQTPHGRQLLLGSDPGEIIPTDLFESDLEGMRDRQAETSEARSTLRDGDRPPLAAAVDVQAALLRARKGGVLSARELLGLGATLSALRQTARFFHLRRDQAPRLELRAASIAVDAGLESDIDRALEPSGEVRDAASRALARARAEARGLSAEIQRKIEQTLREPAVASSLSDSYYTVRNDRYVLPVRADARGSVRGIVHDASNSGTTVFIEPQALVELNNRLRQAELAIERETLRVLRELSERAATGSDATLAGLEVLATIDLAYTRAHLADEMDAVAPELGDSGVLRLAQLRHPIIPRDQTVPNDIRLGESFHVLVVSGPNAGGKTVALKAVALAALFARAGLHVPASEGTRVDIFDAVCADIGDEQSIRESLSTFSAHMANLAEIVGSADTRSLIALDEVGVGTDPGEGAALAQAVLESLANSGARVIATTHYNLLKEMAAVDERFANASVEFDSETLEPTYRLRLGTPGSSSATAVASRMGLAGEVIERANALLAREDRRLDRMLADLGATRAALEHEKTEATRSRRISEAARREYGAKLEALQTRRDQLFRSMREDLETRFRDAHSEIAGVIRRLQREGSAQGAARARGRIQNLQETTRRSQEKAGLTSPEDDTPNPFDWRTAKAGDPVRILGGGVGVLVAMPDRRGRCKVQIGSARVLLPVGRVGAVDATIRPQPRPPLAMTSEPAVSEDEAVESGRCDLRGLRVDEALDRLVYALDRALSTGRPKLVIVHGLGSGALRDAARRYLAESPYTRRFVPGAPDEGGDGVTIAHLE